MIILLTDVKRKQDGYAVTNALTNSQVIEAEINKQIIFPVS